MSDSLIAGIIAAIFFFLGIAGSLIPVFPGNLFTWLGILIHKLYLKESSVSWTFFGIVTAIIVLVQTLDTVSSIWGAKKYGGTWLGALGAFFGLIAGFMLPPQILWIFLGPFLGAIAFEFIGNRNMQKSMKSGIGTLIGGFMAFVLKLVASIGITVAFYLYLPSANG